MNFWPLTWTRQDVPEAQMISFGYKRTAHFEDPSAINKFLCQINGPR